MKKIVVSVACVLVGMAFAVTLEIRNVTAKQRWPWNGKVDITYEIVSYEIVGDVTTGLPYDRMPVLSLSATNRVSGMNYVAALGYVSGNTGMAEGVHHVVWDLNAQGLEFKSDDVVFTVAYTDKPKPYCVVDLSAGANAAHYGVAYMVEPPSGGFNTDEYKTTKMVLRLIEPGTFMMCGQYEVTLTKPFYCGVFEVTQRQYELVMGSNPSRYTGDKRPVEKVSYNMIRGSSNGAKWPSSPAVDSSSFMGKLRTRTGLNFDMPTEAQWEYACRAGTGSFYNNGRSTENDLKKLGRYYSNQSDGKGGYSDAHTTVGSYLPNAWGLYDMHGNVWEWCLDWHGSLLGGVTDPSGSPSGSNRVQRGGSWGDGADYCRSSYRLGCNPSWVDYSGGSFGFRLVRTLSD